MAQNDMLVNAAVIAATASDAAPTNSALAAAAYEAYAVVANDISIGGTNSIVLNTAVNKAAQYLARFLSIAANNQALTVTILTATTSVVAPFASLTALGATAITSPLQLGAVTQPAAVGVGTLTNAPKAGDPPKWVPISINGVAHWVPAWAL